MGTAVKTNRRVRELLALRPATPAQLHRFVHVVLGLDVPGVAITPGNAAPLAYLCDAFFEADADGSAKPQATGAGDCVVWANRGGGKTMLGAAATLLDLLFKPGVQVRILGGSLEQSSKMFEHLVTLFDRPAMRGVLAGAPTQRGVRTVHGSSAQVLAQSQRSVRGVRVHKLRCDEVEAFDADVWAAAQLVTRSGWCGEGADRTWVNGRVEALSTMHRPFGMMSRLIGGDGAGGGGGQPGDPADSPGSSVGLGAGAGAGGASGRRVFRWNYLDVIERCPAERDCDACVLWDDCRGRAKEASGFVRVDDLVRQWRRTSRDTWSAEMLCHRPRRSDSVYPNFGRRHIVERAKDDAGDATLVGGMDFGLRSPTVMLWAQVEGDGDTARLHVIDEYIEAGRTLHEHLAAIDSHARTADHGWPAWLGVDPAGGQRNSHSGMTDIDLLKRHGHRVRARPSAIRDGIERIRRRLDHDTLHIAARCVKLIEAMETYHFDPERPANDQPVKDGPDHACDALRYLVVNLERGGGPVRVAQWA